MIKKIVWIGLFLFLIKANAQHVRAYGGFSAFLSSDFEKNSFGEYAAGVEVKINRFIKPEIGVSYFSGNLEDFTNSDSQGNVLNISRKQASAINYNITPKITFCSAEVNAGDTFIQIM